MTQSFTGPTQLLLILLVQLVPAQISPPPEEGAPRVVMFSEVWAKSLCRPMEQLVDVEQEYPEEVGIVFMPACVTLRRCSGCCTDESLDCHPILQRNTTLEMKKIAGMMSYLLEMTFVEHQACGCRARQNPHKSKRSGESIKKKPQKIKQKKRPSGCGKCQFPWKYRFTHLSKV